MLKVRKSNDIYYFQDENYSAHGVWLNNTDFELTFEGELFIMNLYNSNIDNVRTNNEIYYKDSETILGKTVKTTTTYYNVAEDDSAFEEDNGDWSNFILEIKNILVTLF